MARKKSKGTELSVFKGREAKLNRAIFETLSDLGPLSISRLQKQLNTRKNVSGTYYSSLIKRMHNLENSGYVKQLEKTEETTSKAAIYELRIKAYLASFLDSTSIEELLTKVTDVKAAIILLALLNALSPEKENKLGLNRLSK